METKTFKTLDEQIEILKGKGLVIDDIEYTKNIILRENYFFLMGYRHLFLKDDNRKKFLDGTSFRELYSLFYFDRQLRITLRVYFHMFYLKNMVIKKVTI